MAPLFILLAIAVLPILVALIFRVSAANLFIAIAAGALLEIYMGEDVTLALSTFLKGKAAEQTVRLILLLLPVVLALFITRKSMPKSKVLAGIAPIVTSGALLAALALPLLPESWQQDIFSDPVGNVAKRSQNVAIGVAATTNLSFMLLGNRHKKHDSGHGKHH